VFQVSDGGHAALGQLIADVTRSPYADAVARLVFEPLRMSGSSFPSRWPGTDPDAVTGHLVDGDMAFAPTRAIVRVVPASGGMWTTAADLVRFGASWSSLLPEALAREALRPQTAWPAGGGHFGLGWHIGATGDIIGVGGGGPGTFVSLLIRDPGRPRSGNLAHVAMTNRRLPIQPVNIRALRACCPALPEELRSLGGRATQRRQRAIRSVEASVTWISYCVPPVPAPVVGPMM
jgi:CubicO group peptidase (beta-lactamase class C family)